MPKPVSFDFMTHLIRCLLCVAILNVSGAALGESLQDAPDIPLPEGVVELVDNGSFFDTAEGRIVTAVTQRPTTLDVADIQKFYETSLPNLGWNRAGDGLRFERAAEQLDIQFKDDRIIFTLTPLAISSE